MAALNSPALRALNPKGAPGLGVLREVDGERGPGELARGGPRPPLVAEVRDALAALEVVYALEAGVVQDHHDDLLALLDGGEELRVEHGVGAVPHEGHDGPLGLGEPRAEGRGYLVAHAGEAVLDMVGVPGLGPPDPLHVARDGARGRDHDRVLGEEALVELHEAGRLGEGRVGRGVAHRGQLGVPGLLLPLELRAPGRGIAPGREEPPEGGKRELRVGEEGGGVELQGVKAAHVYADELAVRVLEEPLRAGGEVAEAGAHGDDEVGLLGQAVGGRAAGDAYARHVEGEARVHRSLAPLSLAEGDAELATEEGRLLPRPRVAHAAAHDDEGLLRGGDELGHPLEGGLGRGPAIEVMDPLGQELQGVVVDLALHVLGQGHRHGARLGRIGEDPHRVDHGAHELLGPRDPVPVLAHGLEGVVGRDVAVVELLELLEDGVGLAAGEGVARQEEHGEAVGRGRPGGGYHVEGAGPMEEVTAMALRRLLCLAKPQGDVRGALLVLGLVEAQRALAGLGPGGQGLAQAHDDPVAEDAHDAAEEALFHAVGLEVLIAQEGQRAWPMVIRAVFMACPLARSGRPDRGSGSLTHLCSGTKMGVT